MPATASGPVNEGATPKCPNCGFWLDPPDPFSIGTQLKADVLLFPLALLAGVGGAWFPILYAASLALVAAWFLRRSVRPAEYYCHKCKRTVPSP